MKMFIYSVYDSTAQTYTAPFFFPNNALAIRAMRGVLLDPQHSFSKHAADYTLFAIGEWDDSNGMVEAFPHENLGNLQALKTVVTENI
jgi:hypothetical protein